MKYLYLQKWAYTTKIQSKSVLKKTPLWNCKFYKIYIETVKGALKKIFSKKFCKILRETPRLCHRCFAVSFAKFTCEPAQFLSFFALRIIFKNVSESKLHRFHTIAKQWKVISWPIRVAYAPFTTYILHCTAKAAFLEIVIYYLPNVHQKSSSRNSALSVLIME